MNFITKNLGWILLLLFFIFMLFIISSNDPQKNSITNTGDIIESEISSGETDKNLDDLMKLIDNEDLEESQQDVEEFVVVESESTDEVINESEESLDKEREELVLSESEEKIDVADKKESENKKGFFAKLFGGSNSDSSNEEQTQTGSETGLDDNSDNNLDEDQEPKDIAVKEEVLNISSETNIIKSSSNTSQLTYVDREVMYPGTNLVTSVGNTYEIGVTMLKLNNKTFTQTLGLMNKGDKVKQLSVENSYGCFKVEVIASGKNGYVCKKYLTESDSNVANTSSELTESYVADDSIEIIQENEVVTNEVLPIIPAISTEIGSYYKVAIDTPSFFDVILERFTLAKGDVLKQTSSPNPNTGCVEMKVVGTNTGEHDGKSVSICSPDMVRAI